MSPGAQFALVTCLLAILVGVLGTLPAVVALVATKRPCRYCRQWVWRTARRCPYCRTWRPHPSASVRLLVGLGCLLLGAWPAAAQHQPLLECPALTYFGPGCVVLEILPPEASPAQEPPPLFRRQEMAPDTPDVLLRFLNDQTEANLEAYMQWQQAKQRAMLEAQQKVRTWQPKVR